MDWIECTALLTSIGSCAAAVAAFAAIKQASQAAEAAYRPELAILHTVFECRSNPVANGAFPGKWIGRPPHCPTGEFDSVVAVPLKNFGNGAARKIEVRWSFPMMEALERINRLAMRYSKQCSLILQGDRLEIRAEDGRSATVHWHPDAVHTLEYLLAAPGDPAPAQLDIPPSYFVLVAALVHLEGDELSSDGAFLVPELAVEFTYLDIGGKRHKRRHVLSVQVILSSSADGCFSGVIETGFRA